MKLTLSPIAKLPNQEATTISVAGDILTINGTEYDLSAINEGDIATPDGEHPFIGNITRVNGSIEATVKYFYDGKTINGASITLVHDIDNGAI